jgi:hypothetical protein
MRDTHHRIEQLKDSVGSGAFCPTTLRALFTFEEGLFSAEENGIFRHEYLHFVQATATSLGIKRFILENKLVWKVQLCLHELRKNGCPVELPLTKSLETTDQRIVTEIISRYKAERDAVLMELAYLDGDCTLTDGELRYSEVDLANSALDPLRMG